MSKHTPGPWATDPECNNEIVLGKDGIIVADCCIVDAEGIRTQEQVNANARLIAAAPDLLTACKAVVEEDGFRGSALMRKRVDAMRVAIAKAEAGQ